MRDWGSIAVVGCLVLGAFWMWRGTRPLPRDPVPVARPVALAASVSPLPSASVTPTQALFVVTSAAASLLDEQLYECTDLRVEAPAAIADALAKLTDAGPQFVFDQELEFWHDGGDTMLADALEKTHKGSGKALRPKGTVQILKKSCSGQFSRPVIASCALAVDATPAPKAPTVKLALRLAYYLIPEDSVMSQCIAVGGDWSELDRDSSEYLHAKTQESRRLLMKSLGH